MELAIWIAGAVITFILWCYTFYRCDEDISFGWLIGIIIVSCVWPFSIIPSLIALLHAIDVIDLDSIFSKFGTAVWRWKR